MTRIYIGMVLMASLLAPTAALAVEPAPRISDREIIEGLAGLNAKYTELRGEIRRVEGEIKAEMRAEFKTLRAEIQAVRTELKGEIQAVRVEVHQMDKRLEQVWALLMIVIAGIMGLIGFVIWDRKTAMRPVDQEVQLLKQELDAQRRDAEGFSLTAVVYVLREAAQGSPPIANALKNASLL